jgi:hypothetical protein
MLMVRDIEFVALDAILDIGLADRDVVAHCRSAVVEAFVVHWERTRKVPAEDTHPADMFEKDVSEALSPMTLPSSQTEALESHTDPSGLVTPRSWLRHSAGVPHMVNYHSTQTHSDQQGTKAAENLVEAVSPLEVDKGPEGHYEVKWVLQVMMRADMLQISGVGAIEQDRDVVGA